MLPKIFNPFYTTKPNGTGLGLAIVNRILQNHGGSIEARNEGNGAMFTVTLQQAEAH
jgi:signal transduction histidine kinase